MSRVCTRVIDATPPRVTLPGHHQLLFSHTRFKTVSAVTIFALIFSPLPPPNYKSRLCFVRFFASDLYGAVLSLCSPSVIARG